MNLLSVAESLGTAGRSLLANRMRTALTTLGILFGIAAVIAMMAIGRGAEAEAIDQIKAFGVNNIRIRSLTLDRAEEKRARRLAVKGLSEADALYIRTVLPYVIAVAPQDLLDKAVKIGVSAPKAQIVGTTADYERVAGHGHVSGRFITPDDLIHYRKVCVIGREILREGFLGDSPLGKTVTIGGERFRVVGVMASRGEVKEKIKIRSRDVDRDIYIPITTAQERFTLLDSEAEGVNRVDINAVDEIALQVDSAARLREAKLTLEKILRRRHQGIRTGEVVVPEELLAQSQQTQRLFNAVMGGIAGLSLLVGGIGIMNIMLVAIGERTREIGIRRAVGATQRAILQYFLLEAVLMCLAGGILGILLGFGLGWGLSFYAGWRTIIGVDSVVLAAGVSVLTGLFFGLYPAYRASRLDPIEALRHE